MAYPSNPALHGAWQFVGVGVNVLRVDHETQLFAELKVIAPGAVLLYLGSIYVPEEDGQTGLHILQALDSGPGFGASSPVAPHLRGPLALGACYMLSEAVTYDGRGFWLPAMFRQVEWAPSSPTADL